MVTIKVKDINGAVMPVAASLLAAGYDVRTVDEPVIVGKSITLDDGSVCYYNIDYIQYHTALYISPQFNQKSNTSVHTLLHPRSSIRKYNLVLANSIGLIDQDYRGELLFCFKYIWQPENFQLEYKKIDVSTDGGEKKYEYIPTGKLIGQVDRNKIYKKGDAIGQLVAENTNPIEFTFVSNLDETDRGDGGFGSTTKPSPTTQSKLPDKTLLEHYTELGGVPVKKKYSDEMKERRSE